MTAHAWWHEPLAPVVEEVIALVREAVAVRRAHAAAIAMTPEERHAHPETWRLPELDYEDWYARAEAAVAALDS
jgi:hypothetical protein